MNQLNSFMLLFYILMGSITEALGFVKLSLLFQYLRIFKKGTWQYRASIVGIVLVSIFCLGCSIITWFPCAKISDAWNVFSPTRGKCWGTEASNPTATLMSITIINMFLDFYISVLPLHLFFRPDITWKTRVGLMFLAFMVAL